MLEFFSRLFDTQGFPPRWNCGTGWTRGHGWLHITSDIAIFTAYAAIPIVLIFFIRRRRDMPFPSVLWLFAAFILFCGVGHLVEATIFWHPWYRFSGVIKLCTAIVSWATVIALTPIVPKLIELPSLAAGNTRLQLEIDQRKTLESQMQEEINRKEILNQALREFNNTAVDRELRMVELKEEINALAMKLGETPKYDDLLAETKP